VPYITSSPPSSHPSSLASGHLMMDLASSHCSCSLPVIPDTTGCSRQLRQHVYNNSCLSYQFFAKNEIHYYFILSFHIELKCLITYSVSQKSWWGFTPSRFPDLTPLDFYFRGYVIFAATPVEPTLTSISTWKKPIWLFFNLIHVILCILLVFRSIHIVTA
jgi:hypothetical protein